MNKAPMQAEQKISRETLSSTKTGVHHAARRYDIYALAHKGLRALMADTLVAVGCMDITDASNRREVAGKVTVLLDACRLHLHCENQFVHTAMEARCPGVSSRTAHDHLEHEQQIERLESSVRALGQGAEADRHATAHALYRSLGLFVAENLVHMDTEESENNAALWEAYSDDELRRLEEALVASIPPAKKMMFLRWMVPSVAPAERNEILSGIKRTAPPEVFARILEMLRPHLTAGDRIALEPAIAQPALN